MQIDFTIDQLGILDKAIQQLPYYIAAPLISHINKEIEKQQKIMDTMIDESQFKDESHPL
jgi:16S rRNA A1518/A1519 N6-dimethyltransferase RsmA/KsgA/DIM1 with predicted DNA glycosylase/AP lyase activity